ncbi:hypothetical protein BUALT_Bualt01G0230100 [Buddleja alternifolia]|uniref:ARID domain-containing protein n=1 Tax=Buddleja alternifolia TaxID=168488 RepID=A0AAV6YH47_9LAMI|nr:hypothetical protein BUALT_Bualt01G0230100 [Buddleja alternifolia]
MAGWLNKVNAETEASFDFESEENSEKKLKTLFDEFVEVFLREFCCISCFRPLPPVIGGGLEVDLYKLHIVVRTRGGYCGVSKNGLWSLVARDCGFDLRIGAALKLVYVKYLDTLDRWLWKIVRGKEDEKTGVEEKCLGFTEFFMDLESDLKAFLSGDRDKVEKDGKFVEIKTNALDLGDEDKGFVELNADVKIVNEKLINENRGNVNGGERLTDEDSDSRKRKRECYMDMLNWIVNVAKDPCNPVIGSLPESHKWKNYGNELQWKRILLAREVMLLKKNVDGSSEHSYWQKKQKMHPSMYDDQSSSERLRYSQRLLFAKDTCRKTRERVNPESSSSDSLNSDDKNQSNSTADSVTFWFNSHRQKRVPISPSFQAELPEFQGKDYQSDSKWLGFQFWPLGENEQNKNILIERDRIGKGREESCGCQFPGSLECVKFHILEKRKKIKLELGWAFYKWRFNDMGEEVAMLWKRDEQNKFEEIVKSNCLSSEKYFWDELFKFFPQKGREALVSYYFNVFLLRRRAHQNRSGNSNIDSDDEESEFGPIANRFGQLAATSPGSIFCSPKKSHLNSR